MSSSPANTGDGDTSPTAVPDVESGISQTSNVSKSDDLRLTASKNSTKSPSLLQSILPINTTPAVYIPPDYSFEDRASPLSRIFLLYLDPLFKLGTTRNLNHEDLGIAAAQDKSVQLFETFSHHWRNELNKAPEKRSLWMVLWRTTGWARVCNSVLLYAISAGISYGPILILNQLVLYFQGGINLSAATLWIYVALMFILPMSASIFMAQSNIIVAHIGIQFRNCLVNMIYRKALKLSPASRQQQSTGMIVNMFSNDTKQIQSFLFFFNNCLIAPFQIIVCLILIYLQVGPATFVGLGIMFCVIPFNFYIFMMLNRIRLKKVKKTDIRVKLMNEILSGIRVIKFYAWESAFEKNILAVRKEELILLKQMAYIVAFGFTLVLMAVPLVQPILVFYTYVQLGNQLTAATAFTTIALFNMLQFPFAFLPLGLSQYSQSLVSTKRMLNFFVSDELDGYVTNHVRDDNVVIAAQNLSVCWIKDPPPPVVSSAAVAADRTGDGLISKSVSQVSLNTASNANSSNATATNNNTDKQQSESPMMSSDKKSTKNVQFTDDHDSIDKNKKEYNEVPNNDSTDTGDDHHQLVDIEATAGNTGTDNNAETNTPVNNTIEKTTSDDADGVASSKSVISPSVVSSNNNNRSYSTLVDMNLRIEKGSLVAVVGNVGSGKSSFLSALLGEMHCQNGSINVTGSVAYCEQRPWILNATVEQNILFGETMNQKRFDAAMHAACLEEDIKVLPGGIHTEIGERGINLSGGQKARVALARAVYKKADLYLLDDPLSAVDAHVGQHIFKHCIKNTLKGSTRILVTHQVHLLNQCDLIIVLDDGKIKAQGSYEDLQKSGVDISNYIPFYDSDEESQGELTEYTEGSVSGSDSDEDDEDEEKDKVRRDELKQNTIANSNSTKESASTADNNNNNNNDNHVHNNNSKTSSNIQAVNESWKLSTASATPTNAAGIPSVTMDDVTLEETKQEAVVSNNNNCSHDITAAAVPAVDGDNSTTTTPSFGTDVVVLSDEDKKANAKADERHLDTRGATNIMSIEERIMGDVSANVYSYYIRAGGIFLFLIVIACLLATQATQLLAQFFLASWGDKTANAVENGGDGLSTSENIQQLNTYAWLSMLPLIFMVMRAVGLADHRLGTSVKLHQDCLHRILGAPTAFFDVTPLGRILNRFSSDMLTIDEELSQTISQLSNSVFQCLGAIAAVAGATKGTFLVLMAPLAVFYFQVQKLFRKTNTTIARLESISRSPIYTDFSQALVGAISIRAYKDESRFITKLEQCIDNNSVAAVTSALCSQWLAMRLDFVGACITFFIALIAVATNGNFIPAGYLALGLTNAFQVTTYLKFAVRMIATAEAQMNSVERIKLYAEQVPQEELDESNNNSGSSGTEDNNANKRNGSLSMSKNSNNNKSKDKSKATSSEPTAVTTPTAVQDAIPVDWPNHGEIKVQDIQMAYRDGPLVLKGVSFNVRGGMKVGIAGRTGSGKSSLMIALFRIQELSAGSITIDGIDTAKIPLRVLRSKLGIIPQDPVMFSATVRFNLDPFNEHTDLEIWNILESVDMKNHIVTMEKGLNEEVAEGGDNFSAGQRQLICIARALLRQPKILVLDEATASIDNETDALIQRTIRNSFKDCTVLTIAHRLHTIIDSDRIIVLDNGKLAEIGPPVELLEKPLTDGLFRSLWEKHQASHLEGDYPAYPLADEITLKRTVVRSESSMRAVAFKRTKSSHRSHSNRQFPRNSSAESLGSSGSSDNGSAKKISRKKSNRALVEKSNTHNSMRDSSMMSIPETADENTTSGGGGATPKTPSNTN